MNKSKITVVTVCYNAVRDIEQTIQSVLNQTYPNIEYIIIDGVSTDGTIEVIKEYADRLAYFVSEPDNGIYDAMNKGIKHSTGEWINFLNAGDCFANNNIITKIFANGFDYNNEYGFIYGYAYVKTSIATKLSTRIQPFWESEQYIHGKGFCHQSCFIKTKLAKDFPYELRYKVNADYKMLYDIIKAGYKPYFCDIPIAVYEVENGFSKKNQVISFKECADILGRNNTIRYYFLLHMFKVSVIIHSIVSKTIRNIAPSLFYMIKKRRL